MKPNKRELGTCYYPEHWPEDLWQTDAEQMINLGLKWVRIGEFSWSRLEPKENELYIFPSNLDHYPIPSTSEELRISCNCNLKCNEPISVLFDPKNIRENFSISLP